jgi:hypothetical protein
MILCEKLPIHYRILPDMDGSKKPFLNGQEGGMVLILGKGSWEQGHEASWPLPQHYLTFTKT